MNTGKWPTPSRAAGLALLLVLTACSGSGSDGMNGTGIGMELIFPNSASFERLSLQQAGGVPPEVNTLFILASRQPGGADVGHIEVQNPQDIESADMVLNLAADSNVQFHVSALGAGKGPCLYVGSTTQRIIFGAMNSVAVRMFDAASGCDFIVDFPDPGLANAVRGALELPQAADILASALRDLQVLNAEYQYIVDLTGLGYCSNLEELDLSDNIVKNIDSLSGLTNLTNLDLSFNDIVNMGPLVNNPGLGTGDIVDLANNPLSNQACNVDVPILQGRGVTVRTGNSCLP